MSSFHKYEYIYIIFRPTTATGVDRKESEQEKKRKVISENSKIACIKWAQGLSPGPYEKGLYLNLYSCDIF